MHPGDTVLTDIAKYHVLYPFSTTPTWSLRLFVVVILGIVGGKGGPKNELGFGFFYHRTSIVQVDILPLSVFLLSGFVELHT
jgi:hypothetical protein